MQSPRSPCARRTFAITAVLAAMCGHTDAHAALDATASMTVRKLPVGSATPLLVFQDSVQDLAPTRAFAAIALSPDLLYVSPEAGARVCSYGDKSCTPPMSS